MRGRIDFAAIMLRDAATQINRGPDVEITVAAPQDENIGTFFVGAKGNTVPVLFGTIWCYLVGFTATEGAIYTPM